MTRFKPATPLPSYLIKSLNPNNNFVSFLQSIFFEKQINTVFENYILGATKSKEVIIWLMSIIGKVKIAKIMQYNLATKKMMKHQNSEIDRLQKKKHNNDSQ